MGMGEPLANPRVFDALRVLTAPELFGMSARRLNVSTVGVVPGILKLTEDFPQVNLAFSLHSPFTEERNRLVPLNRMYPMAQVFEVLDQRIRRTGRRVWVAYLMLQGLNDSREHAQALASLIKERPSETRYLYHINLLPYNVGRSVPTRFARAEATEIEVFQQILQQSGISSSFRNSFGHGIDAACGQLYAGYESKRIGSSEPPLVRQKSAVAPFAPLRGRESPKQASNAVSAAQHSPEVPDAAAAESTAGTKGASQAAERAVDGTRMPSDLGLRGRARRRALREMERPTASAL